MTGGGGDNLRRGALFEFSPGGDGGRGGLGFDQQRKVLGHQHPAELKGPGFLADLAQGPDQGPTEALTGAEAAAAIGAGGHELQPARRELASPDRHARNGNGQET